MTGRSAALLSAKKDATAGSAPNIHPASAIPSQSKVDIFIDTLLSPRLSRASNDGAMMGALLCPSVEPKIKHLKRGEAPCGFPDFIF